MKILKKILNIVLKAVAVLLIIAAALAFFGASLEPEENYIMNSEMHLMFSMTFMMFFGGIMLFIPIEKKERSAPRQQQSGFSVPEPQNFTAGCSDAETQGFVPSYCGYEPRPVSPIFTTPGAQSPLSDPAQNHNPITDKKRTKVNFLCVLSFLIGFMSFLLYQFTKYFVLPAAALAVAIIGITKALKSEETGIGFAKWGITISASMLAGYIYLLIMCTTV